MPGTLVGEALDCMEDDDGRVHLIRPETVRPVGDGLYEAITLCGERIVGYPSAGVGRPATCACCLSGSGLA